jgi:hypothetical protein
MTNPKNSRKHNRARITKDVVTRFYVQLGDWILAGPFDTHKEAEDALKRDVFAGCRVSTREITLASTIES